MSSCPGRTSRSWYHVDIAAQKKFNTQGKTTVGARYSPYAISVIKMIWERGQASLRMRVFHEFARTAYRPEALVKRVGNLNGLGDDWLKLGAANVGNPDGGPSMAEPGPGNPNCRR
jgi:hypothetical protein